MAVDRNSADFLLYMDRVPSVVAKMTVQRNCLGQGNVYTLLLGFCFCLDGAIWVS